MWIFNSMYAQNFSINFYTEREILNSAVYYCVNFRIYEKTTNSYIGKHEQLQDSNAE